MNKSTPKVTVLIPGLLESFPGIDPNIFPELPALSKLLSKGTNKITTDNNFETTLCRLFNIHPDDNNELPIAQLTWLTDSGSPSDTALLRADPVHLKPDQTELKLFPANQLSITAKEAKQLVTTLNEQYYSDGLKFTAPTPTRWYLSTKQQITLTTHPLSSVAGGNIYHYLPGGEDATYWKGLFNEIQMLLHNHPVNQQRRDKQQPAINSLWFWGSAPLNAGAEPDSSLVISNEVLAESLAEYTGMRFKNIDTTVELAFMEAAADKSNALIVRPDFLDSIPYGDFNSWNKMLVHFEQTLFKPLLSALKKKEITSVKLLPCNGRTYQVTRSQLFQFWKSVKSFKLYAGAS
jgi:hypothetical protein